MNVDPMPEFQSNQASPSEGKAKISGFRKLAGFSLFFQHLTQRSSQLREQLINLQLGYREQEQTSSWTSWGLTLSGIATLLLAAGIAWTLLMESRRKAAQAEHNRIEAESRRVEAVQEETAARQINQQNQAAILRLMNELQEIAEGIRRVSQHLAELIADISSSAQQQALVSDSVSRNIDSILTVTEHTRHGTQQTAGSIQELAELAKALEKCDSALSNRLSAC
jgi:twitching motility protein PilJ